VSLSHRQSTTARPTSPKFTIRQEVSITADAIGADGPSHGWIVVQRDKCYTEGRHWWVYSLRRRNSVASAYEREAVLIAQDAITRLGQVLK
jgi:hypothetical protein